MHSLQQGLSSTVCRSPYHPIMQLQPIACHYLIYISSREPQSSGLKRRPVYCGTSAK